MKHIYPNKKYYVIAYGSLVSHKSIRKTIPDRHFTSVVIKGYKRIFNLSVSDSKSDKDPDYLNIKKSRNLSFNGVLFQVNEKELMKLKKREIEYNIKEVWAYAFLTGKKLKKGLLFMDDFIAIDKLNKKPKKQYFILCREAAYHISREFGKYWDKTTFTSNGKNISIFLKKNKKYDTIK